MTAIISASSSRPRTAAELGDLKTFTRELMADVEKDLGTKLDWVAVDHWNTDNPHVHVLIRGRADDGQDLVISREYISRGFRDRAAERVTMELGPRSEQEIRTALEKEVEAERWTSLDRALRDISDECGGVADLRPGPNAEDPELRHLLLGRAAKLERLGLADPVGPACWTLKPGLEQTLRQLGIRGDIIKTMHQAMSVAGREPDVSTFALHGEEPSDPVLGRLVKRGLDDELKGTAYAIVDGVDGRTHHLRFSDLEMTGDAPTGRDRRGARLRRRERTAAPVARHALGLHDRGAGDRVWRDLARPPASRQGPAAQRRRVRRRGARRDGSACRSSRRGRPRPPAGTAGRSSPAISSHTLRRRELEDAAAKLSAETGLAHQPAAEGEHVSGVYRQRVTLASGRFAMIDDGLGFQLVPWRPALEKELGREVRGVMAPGGNVEWSFGRKRGLGL